MSCLRIEEYSNWTKPEERFKISNHFNKVEIGEIYKVTSSIPHKKHNGRICKVLGFRYFREELRAKVQWQDNNQIGHVDPTDLKLYDPM